MRNTDKVEKESTLGSVAKVQRAIDFMVLADLQKGERYGKQIDQDIIQALDGVGVNDSYLSQRLKKLAEKGHATSRWENDNRYNRYYEITPSVIMAKILHLEMNVFKHLVFDIFS